MSPELGLISPTESSTEACGCADNICAPTALLKCTTSTAASRLLQEACITGLGAVKTTGCWAAPCTLVSEADPMQVSRGAVRRPRTFDLQCCRLFWLNLGCEHLMLLTGAMNCAPLPEGPEEARQADLARKLEQLPRLQRMHDLQAQIYCDPDHYMARKARALGFSESQSVLI